MAIMGLQVGDGMIFNVISNTRNDAWGHATLALIMPLIGFAIPNKPPLVESRIDAVAEGTGSSSYRRLSP